MRIIFAMKSYSEALSSSDPVTLEKRRKIACEELVEDPNHKLEDNENI
jgi:hypothetical protein